MITVDYRFSGESSLPPPRNLLPSGSPAANVSLVGKRVIIVEDEAITQMLLQRRLGMAGLKVVGFTMTGEEGVELALRERPDIVLMDITMPGMINGIEALRQIQAQFPTCVVMLTAYGEYESVAEEAGASGYLIKPVDSSHLVWQLTQAYQRWLSR